MAKESMKAREVKRAKLVARYAEKRAALKKIIATSGDVAVCTIVARSLVVPKDICAASVSLVFSSVRWLQPVLFLV